MTAVKNDAGEVVYRVANVQDISELKQAEEALKFDEERMEALLRLSKMEWESKQDLYDFSLGEGVRLTRSKGGYLHFFDEKQQSVGLYSWHHRAYWIPVVTLQVQHVLRQSDPFLLNSAPLRLSSRTRKGCAHIRTFTILF